MEKYYAEVRATIERVIREGKNTLQEVLPHTVGADIRLVKKILDELLKEEQHAYKKSILSVRSEARSKTAYLPLNLPAPNPHLSQWWFTLDSIELLATKVWEIIDDEPVAFLGVPTAGYYYSICYKKDVAILDIDEDVVKSLDTGEPTKKIVYNVFDDLPEEFIEKYSAVIVDPPWYPEETELFIYRAWELIGDDGFIFCLIPPRLTRPGIIKERNILFKKLLSSGVEIVSIESDFVKYLNPIFEQYAFKDIDAIQTKPWRYGDLLVIRINKESNFPPLKVKTQSKILCFSKYPQKLRFFLKVDKTYRDLDKWYAEIKEYESNVSTREFNVDEISIWSTNKRAAKARDFNLTKFILENWQQGKQKDEVTSMLKSKNHSVDESNEIISQIDECLNLWKENGMVSKRKKPEEIFDQQSKINSDYAALPSGREHTKSFSPDGFRLEFQRDRDRVLWSNSLKRLSNKCQVFPINDDESIRRRLSHSIEVMQLATTISISFGLNRDLTEAGALVHDIGHTPFGHAGEYALNTLLNEIDSRIEGFNHYEHGLDIVCYLEDAYRSFSVGGFPGLDLTYETIECIIKHTYYRENHEIGQTELVNKSKHKFLKDTSCHLEGQAIRIADKISYLISDLEDGIKMGAISLENLLSCRFFHRPPIDIIPSQSETLYERFISQRRAILKVLMEDILNSTDRRLSNFKRLEEVRENRAYTVDHSIEIKEEISEIWKNIQSGILHRNPKVIESNMRAAKVVTQLFYLYSFTPELIDANFLKNFLLLDNSDYMNFYRRRLGDEVGIPKTHLTPLSIEKIIGSELHSQGANWKLPTFQLILAKDYIASLTDSKALNEYRKHIGLINITG